MTKSIFVPRKRIIDGQTYFLKTYRYGTGWSTQSESNPFLRDFLLFDERFMNLLEAEANIDQVEMLISSEFPNAFIYMRAWSRLVVCSLPTGTKFHLYNFDGMEHVFTEANLILTA